MSHYKTRTYEAEIADISKDGKQIRIIKRTEDRYRPDETEHILTMDRDKAEKLYKSLGDVLDD